MIVVNLTSIPTRFKHLQSVVDNLRQSDVDEIWVHIPKEYTVKTFDPVPVPELRGANVNMVDDDCGPARRYIFAKTGDVTLFVDDDTWYDPMHTKAIVERIRQTGNCWGGSGFNFERYFLGDFSKRQDEQVQVLEGYGMIGMPGQALEAIREELRQTKYYRSDDLIVNSLLEKHGFSRWFHNEGVKQLEYGFQSDALHQQNPEGSHMESYRRTLRDMRLAGHIHFKPTVSYAICVCNEARELEELLEVLMDTIVHADEIRVLVDTGKVTGLVRSVLAKYPVQIHEREFKNDFADHKNYLSSKCQGRYIFNLDADEIPSEHLIRLVYQATVQDTDLVVIPRVNICPGITEADLKMHQFKLNESGFINWPDMQGRIYKNAPGIKWESKVHEKITGAEKIAQVPPNPRGAIWHIKSRAKGRQQREHYLQITSVNL